MEATAGSCTIITDSSARAISSRLAAITPHNIRARRALNQGAIRASSSQIANASDMLVVVPRSGVLANSRISELLLSEADTVITALVGADGSLASNTFIVGEARALTSLSVADTFVRALNNGVGVVGIINKADPGLVLGAGSAGAISTGPLLLAVHALIACTTIVGTAASVARAAIGAVGRNGHQERD